MNCCDLFVLFLLVVFVAWCFDTFAWIGLWGQRFYFVIFVFLFMLCLFEFVIIVQFCNSVAYNYCYSLWCWDLLLFVLQLLACCFGCGFCFGVVLAFVYVIWCLILGGVLLQFGLRILDNEVFFCCLCQLIGFYVTYLCMFVCGIACVYLIDCRLLLVLFGLV